MSDNKKISLIKAMLMSVNIMIGAGILGGTSEMTALAGSLSFLGWIFVAVFYLPVVLSVARMAEVFPEESGFYAYCKQGLGSFVGFIGGWSYFVAYACSTAALLSCFRDFLLVKAPSIILFKYNFLFFIIAVPLLMLLNNLRVSLLASLQSYLTIVKLIPVITAVVLLPFFFKWSNIEFSTENLMKVPGGLTPALFGYLGFEFCSSMVDVIEGGAKQAKKAMIGGFILVTILYVAFHFSLINIMGTENLVTKLAPNFPMFITNMFPTLGAILLIMVPLASMLTYFNSSNGLFFLDSKVLSGLAEGNNVRMAGVLNRKNAYDRPFMAVLITGMLIFAIGAFVPSTKILFAITNFGVGVVLLLANISLMLKDRTACLFDRLVNIVAIIILAVLIVYSFVSAGNGLSSSLQNMTLFFAALVAGVVLYNPTTVVEEQNL